MFWRLVQQLRKMRVDHPATKTADDAVIEEIIVTANKREEPLMEVPQSIQYISGESLEEQGVFALPDVVQLIPSASLPTGTPARIRYSIRALGWLSNDSGIAFYLDDIPLYVVNGGSGDPNIDMFDLESLQVLPRSPGHPLWTGRYGWHHVDHHDTTRSEYTSSPLARGRLNHGRGQRCL